MDVEEIFEVMRTSRQRWTTLRGRGRDWHHFVRRQEAFMRDLPPDTQIGTAVSFVQGTEGPDRSEEGESSWSLSIALPAKIRLEFPVGMEMVTVVFEGSTWWNISPHGARTNEGEPDVRHGVGPGYPLTDPARLASTLDLVASGTTEVAGREALLMTGTPRREGRDFLDEFEAKDALDDLGGSGADEFELAVDVERGVILRTEARLEGQPFNIIEFIEIAFDETLPADAFTLGVPPGTTFESAIPRWWRDRFPD